MTLLDRIQSIVLPSGIKVATQQDLPKITDFVKQRYANLYKKVRLSCCFKTDNQNLFLFSRDEKNAVNAVLGLTIDGLQPLPGESHYKQLAVKLRAQGKAIAEFSRFAIDNNYSLVKKMVKSARILAKALNIDFAFIDVIEKYKNVYEKLLGAKVVCTLSKEAYGTDQNVVVMVWPTKIAKIRRNTGNKKYIKNVRSEKMKKQYTAKEWDDYAHSHSVLTAPCQHELNLAVAKHLSGRVGDFGCGTAKLAAYLTPAESLSYTGLDLSEVMIKYAKKLLAKIKIKSHLINASIESYGGEPFDHIASIHSYYSWAEPEKCLKNIFKSLKSGGQFVLATPSKCMDMELIIEKSKPALIMSPLFEVFRDFNLSLAGNESRIFTDIEDLISQTRKIGFELLESNEHHYYGGVNFLRLIKP